MATAMPNDRRKNPVTVTCRECNSAPGFACTEQGYPLVVCHEVRYQQALLQQKAPLNAPKTKPLSVQCPHCGAMPLRTCVGPPPYRDPKPIHKKRYLAAQKIDNAILRARGRQPKPRFIELPTDQRPWLQPANTEAPPVDVLSPRALAEIKRIRDEARAARHADLEVEDGA